VRVIVRRVKACVASVPVLAIRTGWQSGVDAVQDFDADGETVGTVPRTTTSEIHRYKAYATRSRHSL